MSSVNIVDTTSPDGLAIQGNDEDIDPEEDDELAERLRLGIPKDADIRKILILKKTIIVQLSILRNLRDTRQQEILMLAQLLSSLWYFIISIWKNSISSATLCDMHISWSFMTFL